MEYQRRFLLYSEFVGMTQDQACCERDATINKEDSLDPGARSPPGSGRRREVMIHDIPINVAFKTCLLPDRN